MNLNDYSVKKIYETVGSVKYFGGYKIYMTLRTEYFGKLLCANINGENVKLISDCLKQYIVKSDKLYYIESIYNKYLSFEQKWTFYLRNLDTDEDKALDETADKY